MTVFEPGACVRLRSGGRRMVVKSPSSDVHLLTTSLVLCEYRAKHRIVQGFYAACDLIATPDNLPLKRP
ncbi:hypothetical protein QMK51_02385 [Pseudomonas sp. P9_31]|nr:hypothetical protein [Pseudomonas farris]WPN58505.1 hypothetical protein QMK51_02385 [Pseudomonas sp. P9_31]